MKESSIYLLVTLFAMLLINSCKKDDPVPIFEHDFGSFTDSRDGHVYKTIEIGTQTWFAENLAYEGAGNNITDFDGWFLSTTYEGWCYYSNDKATYGSTYGILYQWGVASRACPEGWHLPNRSEWIILRDSLGGKYEAGGKLKEAGTAHWHDPNEGASNESGFTALPAGMKGAQSPYYGAIGDYAHFWGAENDSAFAIDATVASWTDILWVSEFTSNHKTLGYSVRCLKD
jgi:uncharacterized protein (TIGR02145 family)